MKEYTVGKKDDGKRVDRFLMDHMPEYSKAFIQKSIRTKKIRLNGKHPKGNDHVASGDIVVSYIVDKKDAAAARPARRHFTVVYEDKAILVVNKEAGILSEDLSGKTRDTLEGEVNDYLRDKGERARLCHRLDFNTSGLVLLAKTRPALDEMNRLIRERLIHKTYRCVVLGRLRPVEGTFKHQLFKDARKNQVYVSERQTPGSKTAITHYRVVAETDKLSLVECLLETGRTHQIRCQMAYMGHPVLGDDKYGSKAENRAYGEKRQLLCSWKIKFPSLPSESPVGHLSQREFTLSGKNKPAFLNHYFK